MAKEPVPRLAYSVTELAQALGYTTNTIYAMIQDRRLPVPRRMAGKTVFLAQEVDEFLLSLPVAEDLAVPKSQRNASPVKRRVVEDEV